MLVATVLSLFVRILFQRGTLSPKRFSFWVYVLSLIPSIFLSRYLERIGSPRHDPTTGTLISSGEDLASPGIFEWCFDVVYITCERSYTLSYIPVPSRLSSAGACQVGSGLFGTWVWWLYLVVSTPVSLLGISPHQHVDPGLRHAQVVGQYNFALRPRTTISISCTGRPGQEGNR